MCMQASEPWPTSVHIEPVTCEVASLNVRREAAATTSPDVQRTQGDEPSKAKLHIRNLGRPHASTIKRRLTRSIPHLRGPAGAPSMSCLRTLPHRFATKRIPEASCPRWLASCEEALPHAMCGRRHNRNATPQGMSATRQNPQRFEATLTYIPARLPQEKAAP